MTIVWGDAPPGSLARIYWPAVSSAAVIKVASWMYGVHPLTAADAHTIEVKTIKGVTYVPIPQGTGPGFAGLFTVDLPQTVKTGQEFDIVVRRIGKRLRRAAPAPTAACYLGRPDQARRRQPDQPARVRLAGKTGARASGHSQDGRLGQAGLRARYIVGSFQVKIPVSRREAMLPVEETTLAILKARLEAMSKTNRWYPVLLRYIGQIAGRVDGLGGDAGAIPPSLGGYHPGRRPGRRPHEEDLEEFTGKVREVVFDCFGDFIGFVVDDCCEHRAFESRAREIGDLVLRALKERLTLMVVTAGREHRIVRLVVKG